jgi:hypothetical protein
VTGRSKMRAAMGSADANHAELAAIYRELHCDVFDTHGIGYGFPDSIIGIPGLNDWVEFKTYFGKFTPAQERFNRDWRGPKPVVIRTRDDVIAHVTWMRTCQRIVRSGA